MARGAKRLDLQFGSFACSVQGFDDPVEPVQQVLRTLQHMLEETPELGTAGFAFEADTIEQLIEEVGRRAELDDSEIEIVPGLIIIHHGGLKRGVHVAEADTDEARDEPGYVNIFAPSAAAADDVPDFDPYEDAEELEPAAEADEEPEHADLLADRLGRAVGEDADMPRDIFADSGEGVGSDGSVFADTVPSGDPGARPSSAVNFFSTPLESAREATGDNGEQPSEIEEAVSLRLFPGRDSAGGDVEETTEDEAFAEPEEPAVETTPSDLAGKIAAESVPDLMVSAAAWMVLFKGQTTFSRKDVLGVFDSMPGDHAKSLEARIKGFGKAVRNGQLVMIEDGLFGLSRKELKRFQDVL